MLMNSRDLILIKHIENRETHFLMNIEFLHRKMNKDLEWVVQHCKCT